ncbi:hypothetical protein RBH29_10435 [Herbivorax sp. ANBcel31]|uniref:MXAN_6640 family putative metalloprotease n=1 Tax=Herbivorax sp. ANBcel31 TaxID=3069754 RepID=UPI0027B4D090|nr:MXAN_6640 family putative metalloprotease [Herbivorax sp. ANBcel31]MDQ2086842.1 hypothetical protein [Herbivorax sp. ANBcel31]
MFFNYINKYKLIQGTVFYEKENNSPSTLKNIKINLYRIKKLKSSSEFNLYQKKLISSTKTNRYGKYLFVVKNNFHIVEIDIKNLPRGTGALEKELQSGKGSHQKYNFIVRKIHNIECDTSKNFSLNYKAPENSSIDKIRLSYENKLIDKRNKISQYLNALYDKNSLRSRFTSQVPIKSTTTVLKEIRDYIDNKNSDPSVVKRAEKLIRHTLPDLDKTYLSSDGHFNIHYTLSGENAIKGSIRNPKQVPAYIKHIADAFENVRNITCIKRGFTHPILHKEKDSMDIYVYNLKGVYGYTSSINIFKSSKGTRTASCYIAVDNSYSPLKGFKKSREDCLNVTAAHEYFHAVQFACNIDADFWWMEASATWNEDEIYDDVNDYVDYLKKFFSYPDRSLDKTSYDGVIFAKYLSEYFDGYNTIKKIWTVQAESHRNSIEAIDKTLRENYTNENISTAYNRFAAFNYSPSQFYKEGYLWTTPLSYQNTHKLYPVKSQKLKLNHLSSNYLLFKNLPNSFNVFIEYPISYLLGLKIIKKKNNSNEYEIIKLPFNTHANMAEIKIANFDNQYPEICFVPSNLEKEKDKLPYSYKS